MEVVSDARRETTSYCLLLGEMRFCKYLNLLGFVLLALVAQANDKYAFLHKSKGMQHALVGVCIVDVESGETIASYESDKMFTPASLTKIVTAATVMKKYPLTTRWNTSIGYEGEIVGSTLHGNVVVKGEMDPSLAHPGGMKPTTAFLDSVVSLLQCRGIDNITGHIIVDASRCQVGGWGEWLAEDLGFYYAAVCHGVNYRGNAYELYLRTSEQGTKPTITGFSSPIPSVEYLNYLTAYTKDSALVYITPYATQTLMMGGVPADREKFVLKCAMPDPPLTMAHDIYAALRVAGINVCGAPFTHRSAADEGIVRFDKVEELGLFSSDSLRDMLQEMMYKSNNLYAEALLRYLSLSVDTVAHHSTALNEMENICSRMGLDVSAMKFYDGCGLARKNLVTPQFLASLLVEACRDEALGNAFVSLFPRAGREGTVKKFMSQNPLSGELRLKSGSMAGVLCYAGYYTVGAKRYAVVMMSNHHTCGNSVVRRQYETLLRNIFGRK